MKSEIFEKPDGFFKSASQFLEAQEAINSLFLGSLTAQVANPPTQKTFMCTVSDSSQISLAALYFRLNLILSHGSPDGLQLIVRELSNGQWRVPGVIGPKDLSEQFSALWAENAKCSIRLGMRQRIYKLTKVNFPTGVAGQERLIQTTDIPLVAEWIQKFHVDARLPEAPDSLETELKNAEKRVIDGKTFFWVVDGHPVCMAAHARPTANGMTVNAVFTPKEHRGKGYASALVARVSEVALMSGKKFCVLYTDLDNPTSNSIYQKVGYQPVCDSVNYRFDYT